MGLWEFLKQWQRGRLVTGVVASLLIHVLLALLVTVGLKGQLIPRLVPKRGDTIIVELPKPEEQANAGTPSQGSPAPPAPATPARPPSPPAARPTPPPRETPAPREERRVASAPRPTPAPAPTPRTQPPAPRAAEPLPRTSEPAPSAPEPEPTPAPTPRAQEAAPRPQEQAQPAPEPSPRTPAVERREGADRQVASVPPSGGSPGLPSKSDVKAALRGGAGGQGRGHGGIEGTPIRLDSTDERFSDYLEQIRRRIQEKWGFPCVRSSVTRQCEVHDATLDVHFGILKDGRVQYVDLVRSSEFDI
jgi:hypothetical protein